MNATPVIRQSVKIAVLYAFTLITAAACGKIEGANVIKSGTNRGTATVGQGLVVPANEQSVTITSAHSFGGGSEYDGYENSINIKALHGTREVDLNVFPSGETPDGVQQTVGTIDYLAQGLCADTYCTKFAILLTVTDTSNGSVFQRAQYYENQTLVKNVASTRFKDVAEAYTSMTGQAIASN